VQPNRSGIVVVVGRDLRPPWNEGNRVITRNLAIAMRSLRPTRVLSITQQDLLNNGESDDRQLNSGHVVVRGQHGTIKDHLAIARLTRRLARMAREQPIDLVHLVNVPLGLAPWLRRRGIRVVAHVQVAEHAYVPFSGRVRKWVAERAFDRWVDAYALSAPALISPLVARGIEPSKLVLVPAAIDTDVYAPGDRSLARAAANVDEDEIVLVYVGTLSPVRFPVATIRAGLQRAAERAGRSVRLFAFAPLATHAYNRSWRDDVERQLSGVPNVRAEVVLRDMGDADKRLWFQLANAVVVPFGGPVAVEPPLTVVEAMACGAVVLVSPQANRSALVEDGRNGFVFATPDALAAAVVGLGSASTPDEAQAIGHRARATAVQRHSFAATTAAVERLWADIGTPPS